MASRNVILYDKDDNQLAPATLSELVEYDDNNTVKDKIIELNERIDNLVTGNVEPLEVTANGTYTAPQGVDGFSPVTVNVGLPNLELVCEYDFTSATPKKDNARYGVEGQSNYITFDTSKGIIFDNASSRFFNPFYNLNEGNSYKIEIEFGDIILNASMTGKRNIFTYVSDATKYNENSNSLGWDVSTNSFKYHTGAGDRYINKPVDYWANDKITLYYGLSVDTDGKLYLPSVYIDNSSSKSLIIMDKDLITELTAPFTAENPNILLGGGNNFYYMEIKKFRIYRINNLTSKSVGLTSTTENKTLDNTEETKEV